MLSRFVSAQRREVPDTRVWVGGLDASTTQEDLRRIGETFGEVTAVELAKGGKLFGWVTFAESSVAETVTSLKQTPKHCGRRLKFRASEVPKRGSGGVQRRQKGPRSQNLGKATPPYLELNIDTIHV